MDKNEKIALGLAGVAAAGIIGYKYLQSKKQQISTVSLPSTISTIPTETTSTSTTTSSSTPTLSTQKTTSTTTSTTTTQPTNTTTPTSSTTTSSTSSSTSSTTSKTSSTSSSTSSSSSTTTTTSTTTTLPRQILVTIDNNCRSSIGNVNNAFIDITYIDPSGSVETTRNGGYRVTIPVQPNSRITLKYKIIQTHIVTGPSTLYPTVITSTKTVTLGMQNVLIKACQNDLPSPQIIPITQQPSQYYIVEVVNPCAYLFQVVNYIDPFGQKASITIPPNPYNKQTIAVKAGTTITYNNDTGFGGSIGPINSDTTITLPCIQSVYHCGIVNNCSEPATVTWTDPSGNKQTATLRANGGSILITVSGKHPHIYASAGSTSVVLDARKCVGGRGFLICANQPP